MPEFSNSGLFLGNGQSSATWEIPSGRNVALHLLKSGQDGEVVPTACERKKRETFLTTGAAFADQDLNFSLAVLGPAGTGLVRCGCSVLAHRTWCHDVPHQHVALLEQKSDHGFSAVLAQRRVHLSSAGRVGIARHLDEVSLLISGGLRQLLEFFLVRRRDRGATGTEMHGCLAFSS
jgi:hypothetical protein